jgi:hypothetical protein
LAESEGADLRKVEIEIRRDRCCGEFVP